MAGFAIDTYDLLPCTYTYYITLLHRIMMHVLIILPKLS